MVQSRDSEELAHVLWFLKKDQRVSYAHIARPGKLSRNTVKLILDGTTRNPTRETVCKVLIGLALDPDDGTTDQEFLKDALARVTQVPGYEDLVTDWLPGTLECLLAAHVGDLAVARAWLEMIRDRRDAGLDEIAEIRRSPRVHAPRAVTPVSSSRSARLRRRRRATVDGGPS
jgi:hypothetical protein